MEKKSKSFIYILCVWLKINTIDIHGLSIDLYHLFVLFPRSVLSIGKMTFPWRLQSLYYSRQQLSRNNNSHFVCIYHAVLKDARMFDEITKTAKEKQLLTIDK